MLDSASYASTPLDRKLAIGEGDEVAIIGAPEWFEDAVASLPDVASLQTDLAVDAHYDVIVTFITQRAELESELPRLLSRMAPACGLWVAWPHRASRAATDMSEEVVRQVALSAGLVDTRVCAIDDTWSALRLMLRRQRR